MENNMKQGFAKHFQNLNLKLAKVGNHGHIYPNGLYHEKVPDRLREQILKQNIEEMRAQTLVDVTLIFVAPIRNLLHQNHIGVAYASNFRMELVRSVPLYFVAMPKSIIIVTKPSFVS
jgi:hypothetical protein